MALRVDLLCMRDRYPKDINDENKWRKKFVVHKRFVGTEETVTHPFKNLNMYLLNHKSFFLRNKVIPTKFLNLFSSLIRYGNGTPPI